MLNIIKSRKVQIFMVLLAVFIFLGYSLHDLTIKQGAYYHQRSINNRVKRIETSAKRGEIFDRNGVLLATNEISYSVKINSAFIPASDFSKIAIGVYDFLNERGESQLEFPIFIENGQYKFRFDENIVRWLELNGYDATWTAEEVFADIRSANYIDSDLSHFEAYRILFNQGKYLPISTRNLKFLEENNKTNFLSMYGLPPETSAKEAFETIRKRSDFRIPSSYSDVDAYKVMVLRHAIREQGFLKYEPITIAKSIGQETAIAIQERGYEFPGLYVDYETIRRYPYASTAAHILGYMGPIATESEIATYIESLGYNRNQIIGKTGIEGVYETRLHGSNGYKFIEVDVYGRYVADVDENVYGLEAKQATSGEDIYLSIDLELQLALESILEKGLKSIQTGALYESPWGDMQYDPYPNAEMAAGVVVDVRNGEVLAMASYPSYDVNMFSTGISQQDWNALNPVNKRNPLAARPLFNAATMMAVQPGSVYKMITGYAALEQGLNPNQNLYSDGYVEIGQQRFGCWLWNDYGRKHGPTNLYKAIEVSCNYYFFNIATGKDFYRNVGLPFFMNAAVLTESSKQFGLHERTGLEISEVAFGLPDPDRKKRSIEALLASQLRLILKDYFPEHMIADEDDRNAIVSEIISWSTENPPRGQLITKLMALGSSEDYYVTEQLADLIKYDYFNLMRWYESDTLNLSIGQGDHAYTPAQIVRYIASVANGGYLHPLTVMRQIGDEPIASRVATESFDDKDLLKHIQQGMRQVINGPLSSTRRHFDKFPVSAAGKTGTAQKEGLIPPLDEVAYLTEYLSEFARGMSIEAVEARTLEILKSRSEELAELERLKNNAETDEERERIERRFNQLIERDYLNKGSAMRVAIKELSGGRLTDEQINQFRLPYDNYSWFVGYAPYESPEIAVVVMVPQGGSGNYSAPLVRDIMASYFKLIPEVEVQESESE